MQKRNKLAIFDLDGTLFDTKEVNYVSYSKALENCGIFCSMNYAYYRDFCNGNSYKVFLPQIVPGISDEKMLDVHDEKKRLYKHNINKAIKNEHLFSIIQMVRDSYLIAIVTTASRENTEDILQYFGVDNLFDIVITQEDVSEPKPSPEGFLMAMEKANVTQDDTVIFEDSEIGLEAAKKSGAKYVKVYGFN